jgi:hypothetical protein
LNQIQNELRFTRHGQIICCDDEADFVGRIATTLGFSSVYGSRSDDGSKISRIMV